jgi:hypothetical protein
MNLCDSGIGYWDLWLHVNAYMMWPEDEAVRCFYVARHLAGTLARLSETEKVWQDSPSAAKLPAGLIERTAEEARRRLGEALSLAGGGVLGDETLNPERADPRVNSIARKQFWTAGVLLSITRQLAAQEVALRGGASIQKAVYILENYPWEGSDYYTNRTDIWESWRLYKKSSHFINALLVLDYNNVDRSHEGCILHFLSIARDYQKWALDFRPIGARRPLFASDELWLVPDKLKLPDVPFATTWALPHAMIEVVNRYRAKRT